MKKREIDDLVPFEERVNSLTPKPNKRKGKQGSSAKSTSTKSTSHATTQNVIHDYVNRINQNCDTWLSNDQDPISALQTLNNLYQLSPQIQTETDSIILNRIVSAIESHYDNEIEWKKFFIVGGAKFLWIVGRNLVPHMSEVENLLNAIEARNYVEVVVGVVRVANPQLARIYDCGSWIIRELR